MLRVERHDTSNTTWLRVEGRLVGTFAEDVRSAVVGCKFLSSLIVDLTELMFVDAGGEEVLLWLGGMGAQFVADNTYSLDVCERLHLPLLKGNVLDCSHPVQSQ